ncbi:low-temperature-induced 65 kDa protein [Cucumis melo]|uniref:Low-temperature-induced 65 kDa protein n=1 Tax=Cucumis melo TaxID=3656 RepID=A0ABM3KF02_CUCME|nr:low-temperature-induced 65 kDa protein [Cucumis melo]
MSQFHHMQIYGGNATPTMEQLLRDGEASRWPPTNASPVLVKDHDLEDDIDHHQKKSVFTKVKEKAKKLRNSLSNKKRHGEDENITPSWGYNLDEDEEEEEGVDAEYLGAPMYESELAPEDCKENARQHPRADPVIAENHTLANTIKLAFGHDEKPSNSPETLSQMAVESSIGNSNTSNETTTANSTMKIIQEKEVAKPSSPNKTLTETMTEKLAPVYSTVTDATHAIASKIQSLTISSPSNSSTRSSPSTPKKASSLTIKTTCSDPIATQSPSLSKGTEQIWDKGVSVKEYLMHKFEPGEDERALSQVLSDALSPRAKPGIGVVEKVREAVNSMLRAGDAPQPKSTHLTAKSSSQVEVAPQPVAAHSVARSSSRAEKAPELVAAKSVRAESTPPPMAAHLAAKPSSSVEKTPQAVAAKSSSHAEVAPQAILALHLAAKPSPQAIPATHLAAKPSPQARAAPQAIPATHLAAKPSLSAEATSHPMVTHLAAKPSLPAEATPQPMVTHLAAKPSLPAEATPQPIVTHLAAKSSASAPVFTTTHRVAEEENLERILQAN